MNRKPDKQAAKAAAKDGSAAPGKGRGKGKTGAAAEAGPGASFSIAAHPRARQSVRQIKSGVGLGGFLLALILSLQASVPLAIAAERALILGVTGYLLAWACAVAVWRSVISAEVRARVEALTAHREPAVAPAKARPARR